MRMVDGYGAPVRLVIQGAIERPMAKSVGAGNQVSFDIDGYTFTWLRKGPIGVLTCIGANMPIPFHTVVSSVNQVRSAARDLVADFKGGRVPAKGVFRRLDVPVTRYTPAT